MITVKICGSVRLFAVNPGGYFGEGVKREIVYAEAPGKDIVYME
jgi:hypothetical protein